MTMNYREAEKAVKKIIKAVKKGDYKVSYTSPENIEERTYPDGTVYYKVYACDDATSSTGFGGCTVEVAGYSLFCDWGTGKIESEIFDGLDLSDVEYLTEDLADAFCDTEDIFSGTYTDMEDQEQVYKFIYGIKDAEFFFYDDPERPDEDEDF